MYVNNSSNGCRPAKEEHNVELTHLLMDSGKFSVNTDEKLASFRMYYAQDLLSNACLCISENHSQTFPFYVDWDRKGTTKEMSDETILKMVKIMQTQIMRFFADRNEPFVCIVCTKTKGADEVIEEDGSVKYKHGIHLHWPDLMVDIERAYYIRASMIAGLDRFDWTHELGAPQQNWEGILDHSVYKGGLRMVGAPKAVKCSNCKARTSSSCHVCGNRNGGYIINPSTYAFHLAVRGENVDEALTANIRPNMRKWIDYTTVRAKMGTPLTPGYARYTGCPLPNINFASGSSSKRKVPAPDSKLEKRFKKNPEITDPQVCKVMRELLLEHSEFYRHSRMSIRFDGKMYKISLTGDGGHYCLNKGGDHNGQHVFMEITQTKSKQYESRMGCYCDKPTVAGRLYCRPCKDYRSRAVPMETEQVDCLFPTVSKDPKQKMIMLGKEIERLRQERLRGEI